MISAANGESQDVTKFPAALRTLTLRASSSFCPGSAKPSGQPDVAVARSELRLGGPVGSLQPSDGDVNAGLGCAGLAGPTSQVFTSRRPRVTSRRLRRPRISGLTPRPTAAWGRKCGCSSGAAIPE